VDRVFGVAEEGVYTVMLAVREISGVDVAYLYRGPLPVKDQEIEVENEFKPGDRRRGRVTGITGNHRPAGERPLIHAQEVAP
jgi:hypothetical protein